jgi:acetoacetate decarboxylase
VDSPVSREAGRSLWALPKELADLPLRTGDYGPVVRTSFSGVAQGRHLASATFTTVPRAAMLRLPFATATSQPGLDGEERTVVSRFSGSAQGVPSRAVWRFDADGPLAFLRDRRPVASFHLRDVALRFG